MKITKLGWKITRTFVLILLIWLLPGCNFPVRATTPVLAAPTAWIDGPMDGSTIPLEPYEVIFHVADVGGVALGELSINGQIAANIPVAVAGETLATLRYLWTPPSPGEYTLTTRAQNAAGMWGDSVSAKVTVKEIPPTFTPTPTITLTPTPTVTPTSTQTEVPTKTATLLPVSFSVRASVNQIYNGSCDVNQTVISAQLSHAAAVGHVELFIRLQGVSGNWNTDWYSYGSMSNQGGGLYQITVNATNLAGTSPLTKDTVYYQLVAFSSGGKELGRSVTYNDIVVSPCLRPLARPTATYIPAPK